MDSLKRSQGDEEGETAKHLKPKPATGEAEIQTHKRRRKWSWGGEKVFA